MKQNIRKIYRDYGGIGANDWQNKNCDDVSQYSVFFLTM